MARDPKADALHRLYVAHATDETAKAAKVKTRELLDKAINECAGLGIPKTEIARVVGTTAQRVGQVVAAD